MASIGSANQSLVSPTATGCDRSHCLCDSQRALSPAGPKRLLTFVTLTTLMTELLVGQLLDPIDMLGICFPFGIDVSRTQCIYAIITPLLAVWIVRMLDSKWSARS